MVCYTVHDFKQMAVERIEDPFYIHCTYSVIHVNQFEDTDLHSMRSGAIYSELNTECIHKEFLQLFTRSMILILVSCSNIYSSDLVLLYTCHHAISTMPNITFSAYSLNKEHSTSKWATSGPLYQCLSTVLLFIPTCVVFLSMSNRATHS